MEYTASGCNETILTGCSQMGSIEGHFNLMYSLNRLWEALDGLFLPDFEAFYHLLEKYLKEDLSVAIQLSYERDRECAKDPEILGSVFTDGCIERAVPASQGGARYNFCTWCLIGLVNLAN